MELRYHYDQSLRTKTLPVEIFDEQLKSEAAAMFEIMKENAGLGLAANQVGLTKQLIVYGYNRLDEHDELPNIPFTILVNPVVVSTAKETESMLEGCLSLPGIELPVTRSVGVTVRAQNVSGEMITVKAKGMLARIIQHEIDHLNGILFTDRVSKNQLNKLEHYQWLRTVFVGSDDFSLTVFNQLQAVLPVMAVVTETGKPAGRGQIITEPVMVTTANQSNIAVFQPESKHELTEILKQLKPDLLVLASYGKILPAEALAVPLYGSLNLHPSLLPKYRGATPIQQALLNGDSSTGVTLQQMSELVDAGHILAQAQLQIESTDNAATLRAKLAQVAGNLLVRSLPAYICATCPLQVQAEEQAVNTKKFNKEDGLIDWQQSNEQIVNQIRALNPWPGTYTLFNGKRLALKEAELQDGLINIKTVQLEGKKATDWPSFVNGYAKELTKQHWTGKIAK